MKKYKLKDKIILEWINEYTQLNTKIKWNWFTVTLIHVFFEYEYYGYHFQVTLLGLGFYFRYNTNKSLRLFKKWDKETKLYEK
jgi:hypothetical protein